MLELVVVMKLLLVVLRIGVGRVCNICWFVGMVFVGGKGVCVFDFMIFICDGGIYGVKRCILL